MSPLIPLGLWAGRKPASAALSVLTIFAVSTILAAHSRVYSGVDVGPVFVTAIPVLSVVAGYWLYVAWPDPPSSYKRVEPYTPVL